MKYGKYLASRQLELPEYSGHFIDYKSLKKLIKQLAKPTSNNTDGTTVNQNEIHNTLKENKASFFFRVERELDKVNSFYLEKQANLAVNLDLLMMKYNEILSKSNHVMKNSGSPVDSVCVSDFRNSITYLNLYQNFKKIHQDLIRLQQFIELNETGFSKVLKKWDKRSKSHTKELFLSTAVNVQPAFHKNEINELSDLVTQSIFDLESMMDGDFTVLNNYTMKDVSIYQQRFKHILPKNSFNSNIEDDKSDTIDISNANEFQPSRNSSIVPSYNNQIDELYRSFVNIATIKDPDLSLLARWIDKVKSSSKQELALSSNSEFDTSKSKLSKILLLAITSLKISDSFLESFLNLINYEVEFTSIRDDFNNNKNIIHECCSIPSASIHENSHHVVINNGVKVISSTDSINHSRIFILHHIMTNTPSKDSKNLLVCKDFNGRTCLHYAAQNNRLDILEIIMPYFPKEHIDDIDNESMSALLLAIKFNNFDIIKKLIESGSNCCPQSTEKRLQYLPINYACKFGDYRTLEYLLSYSKHDNSSINQQDVEGLLPLHVISRSGHYKLIALLIKQGAEINKLDGFNKWTPIFYAASEGHVKTTQELVKYGAKLDIFDEDGYNVLYYCVIEGHINVLNEILSYQSIRIDSKIGSDVLGTASDKTNEIINDEIRSTRIQDSILGDEEESEDSGTMEKNNMDSIPDLVLPPPILPLRRYGHNFLEQKILIEITFPKDAEFIRLFNSETDLKPGRITLTSNISDIVPRNLLLPISDTSSSTNCIFQTDVDSLPEFRIDFEVFPKFGTRLIAKTTALSMSQFVGSSSEENSMKLPLFDLRLRNIGELRFNYQVIFPFSGVMLETSKFDTYWKSSTSYLKNDRTLKLNAAGGLSPNNISSQNTINANNVHNGIQNDILSSPSEFTKLPSSSVVTATSLSGEYLRIKLCLLKDGTPIVCPHWSIAITDNIELYLPNLSLEQLSSITDSLFDYDKVIQDLSQMTSTNIVLIKKLLRIIYLPLSLFLDLLCSEINLNLEILFPSSFEIQNLSFVGNIQSNLNNFVDFTLNDVFNHIRSQKIKNNGASGRSILFLSSNSLICKILNWKQPNFPVFLIINGISYNQEERKFESRTTNGLLIDSFCNDSNEECDTIAHLNSNIFTQESSMRSIKEAVSFAVNNNLIGIILSIHLLVLVPKLMPLIRSRGLVLVASSDIAGPDDEFTQGDLDSYLRNEINGLHFDDILSFKEDITM